MRIIVLLNCAASAREPEIRAAFAAIGADADVRALEPDKLHASARDALAHADVIVAAGGDGTINAVASALAGSDKPMGVLACGTLNHFAKDLGLPLNLHDAAKVIAA